MQSSAWSKDTLAAAEIDAIKRHAREPCMHVTLRQRQEQPLGFHALALTRGSPATGLG